MQGRGHLVLGIALSVALMALTLLAAVGIQAVAGPIVASPDVAKKEPAETPKDQPAAAPKDQPAAQPKDQPAAAPKDQPTTQPKDQPAASPKDQPEATPKTPPAAGPEKMAPLDIKLPRPQFLGTPKNIPPAATLEKYNEKPRPPFLAPEGTTNVALGKPVDASDKEPVIGDLSLVTNGDKEATDGSYVELGPGLQYVQIDLKEPCFIYAIVIWHYHKEGRVYHDVVVQVADDADFITPHTIFNDDFDNSSGLGIGKNLEYIEDARGKLIDAKGIKARYVRLYSRGNTSEDQNHYIEVEVYGKVVK